MVMLQHVQLFLLSTMDWPCLRLHPAQTHAPSRVERRRHSSPYCSAMVQCARAA
ncbi:unnamed protein product, partial [Nesidiocoris tenuis]